MLEVVGVDWRGHGVTYERTKLRRNLSLVHNNAERNRKRQIRLQFPPLLCNQISQEEVIFEKGRYASRQQNEDFELFELLQFLLIDLLREM